MGELDRVGQQIEQDLLELCLVDPDHHIDPPMPAIDRDEFLVGKRPDGRNRGIDQIGRGDGLFFELDLAGLYSRQIKDAVDQFEQVNSRVVDVLRVFGIPLFRLLCIELDDFRKPNDGVERRSQFM